MKVRVRNLVIIYVDTLRREFTYCYVIKTILEKMGYHVILTSRRNLFLIKMFIYPEVLILSHSFILSREELEDMSRHTDVYVITVECVGDETLNYPTDFPDTEGSKFFKGIFVWNEHYRNWVIKNINIAPEKVYASGSPRVNIAKYLKRNVNNGIIGFIGRFDLLNDFNKRSPLEGILSWPPSFRRYKFRYYVEVEGALIYVDLMDYLVSKGYKVSLRPHPQELLSTYEGLKNKYGDLIEINEGIDYLEWLESVDFVISVVSTSLSEAILTEKPVISIDRMFKEDYMLMYDKYLESFLSVSYTPKTLEEAISIIEDKPEPKKISEEMYSFYGRFYNIKSEEGYDCIEKIVSVIDAGRKNRKPCSRIMKFLFNSFFYSMDYLLMVYTYLKGKWHMTKHYNYCIFIHKPTPFMKRVSEKVMNDFFRKRANSGKLI